MRKLIPYTLEQLLVIYQLVRDAMIDNEARGFPTHGFCFYMDLAICKLFEEDDHPYVTHAEFSQWDYREKSEFSELIRYKPKQLVFFNGDPGGRFWFPINEEGYHIRLYIINQVIDEIESAIKLQNDKAGSN